MIYSDNKTQTRLSWGGAGVARLDSRKYAPRLAAGHVLSEVPLQI
jgi:hypothetical protein